MATAGEFENISAEIKNKYPNPSFTFEGAFRTQAKYRAKLKKNNDYGMNDGIVKFGVKLSGMWSGGIPADNAAMPIAKNPSIQQATLKPETFAYAFQVGLKTTKAANSAQSSIAGKGVVVDRIEDSARELASIIDRVYVGSNKGRLAIVESDGTSNFVAAKPTGTTLLEEGMVLEAYTALTGGSVRDSFSAHTITDINHDTRTVTYISAATQAADDRTLVAGDSIFLDGSYAQTPVSMDDIVDNGTNSADIFALTRATYPKLNAHVLSNGGVLRNVTEQLMLDACDLPRRLTGKDVTRILANSGQGRKYCEFVAADRRYPGATEGDPRYSTGYNENSLQVVAPGVSARLEINYEVKPRNIYFLAWDTFFLYEAQALDWLQGENGVLHLSPGSGTHNTAYLGYMCSVENQGCTMPRANSVLSDLKDPILSDG